MRFTTRANGVYLAIITWHAWTIIASRFIYASQVLVIALIAPTGHNFPL